MSDHTEDALADSLRDALRSRGDEIHPTPALPGILHRAGHSRSRSPWRRWAPVLGVGIASVGLVAGALVVVGTVGDEPDAAPPVAGEPDPTPPSEDGVVTAPVGSEIPMAVYASAPVAGTQYGDLIGGEFIITSSGDVGIDAVTALLELETQSPDTVCNLWSMLDDPAVGVASVTHLDGVVTVDLDRDVSNGDPFPDLRLACGIGAQQLQQLVHTVTSALRTDDPVLMTVNGEQADAVFGEPVDGPVEPDPSVLRGIRPATPEQGAVVSGSVTVTGEASTPEGNIVVRAYRDGEQVAEEIGQLSGFEFEPYELTLNGLEPGDYTLKTFTGNQASGAEAYAEIMYPVYTDVTVE